MKKNMKTKIALTLVSMATAALFVGCDGGGGGGAAAPVYYPYETVYGDVCTTSEATPGCTFNRDGSRVSVAQDPTYNKFGYGSDDLWYVKFSSSGSADVYDDLGNYQYSTSTSNFAGWVGGNTVGVGTTGLFWENVSGGTYWLGKNGVLYNAMPLESNYGKAINNKDAGAASDTNFAALSTEANKALIKAGAQKLMKDYNFKADKAQAVAEVLNNWAVNTAERGYTTETDMNHTFKTIFGGAEYSSALAAVKDLQAGDPAKMRELTNRTASALGLQPHEAQKFMKGMYSKALASWGYDVNSFQW